MKNVFITGASRGIGNIIAKHYIDTGAHVIALGKDVKLLEELDDYARDRNSKITIIPLDLKKTESILKLGEILNSQFHKIDVLILNAAILGEVAPIEHYDHKIWDDVITINLNANFYLLKTLTPLLKKSQEAKVLFISCKMSKENNAYWGAYAISKHALEKMADVYYEENKHCGIKVEVIEPELFYTGISKGAFPGRASQDICIEKIMALSDLN